MSRTARLPVAMLLALLSGCVGYQIGNQSLYPRHIETVYVPMFESASFRRNQGERLTEAVCKEIELKTDYKVVHTPDADSVLSGRIVGDTKHVVVGSRSGESRESEVGLQVDVSWVDRRGNALRDPAQIAVPPEVVGISSSASLVPEAGHSIATAQQQAIHRLAEQIVALMEAPW